MNNKILRLSKVKEATGLSRSTIYRQISQGNFPQCIPLGGRAVGWIEQEVDAWIKEQIKRARRNGTIQERA